MNSLYNKLEIFSYREVGNFMMFSSLTNHLIATITTPMTNINSVHTMYQAGTLYQNQI